ncbi:MAG: PfkB family carbohydrate kinase [Oscillospiraceae bacterium]|nr:PfkB family carbohydrate kinase [Oscillospiraceae bacterium]
MSKILAIGEILWDVFPDKEIIGGAPFNLAVHAQALGCEAYILSRVGGDRRGAAAAEQARLKGINTKYIQVDGKRDNGVAVVTLKDKHAPEYTIPPDASHEFIEADDSVITAIKAEGFDMLCYGTLAQKNAVSRASIQRVINEGGAKHRFFDVNLRMNFHDRDVLDYSFGKASIVKINDGECGIVSEILFRNNMTIDDFAAALSKRYGVEHILVTLGKDGCAVYSGGKTETYKPPAVTVADTVGAGDAFSAGFIYSFLRGDDVFAAARFGNAMGSFVASKHGATPELVMEELDKLAVMA